MKKLFVFCFFAISILFARADVSEPDFAYPQQVITNAEQLLKSSQKSGDGIATLQALMQISVAQGSIDRDSMQYVARRVLTVAAKEKKPQVKALIDLYAATVINNIYQLNKYKYNRRQLPLTPRPADMTEWSGEMFTAVIDSLCSLAWRNAGDMSINNMDRVVEADDLCRKYYPTQADFVASQIINNTSVTDSIRCQVRNEMAEKHSKYSAGWFTWQLINNSYDNIKDLMHLYTDTPSEYRSNAMLVFQYIYNLCSSDVKIDDYGADTLIADIINIQPEVKGTWAENELANILLRVQKPWAKLMIPSLVIANQPFDIKIIGMRNLQSLTLDVYADSKTKTNSYIFPFNNSSAVPSDSVVHISLPAGAFSIKAYVTGNASSAYTRSVKSITAYPFAISNENGNAVHVVDPNTGNPIAGATVAIDQGLAQKVSAITDKNGLAHFSSKISGNVYVTHNGVTQSFSTVSLRTQKSTNAFEGETYASFTTDRPIYMPADSVHWGAVVSLNGNVVPNRTLNMKVVSTYDDSVIAEISATTDDFGAMSGSFVVPENAMACNYNINCTDKNVYSSSKFIVAEFKPESIKIDNYNVWPQKTDKISAVVSGTVTNYSGFGVDNATVECTLADIVVQGVTDSDGKFEITVPYPADFDRYANIEIRVTATDGSVASEKTSFCTMQPYEITIATPNSTFDVSSPVKINVKVIDPLKNTVNFPVVWSLIRQQDSDADDADDEPCARGEFSIGGEQTFDFSNLTAGRYYISFELKDSDLSLTSAELSLTLFNSQKNDVPNSDCVWVFPSSVVASDDGKSLSMLVGSKDDNTVLYTLAGLGNDYVAHNLKAGYQTLTIDISNMPNEQSAISAYAVRNLNIYSQSFNISRVCSNNLKFNTETFRDNIYAQSTEHWQFSVTDRDGKAVQSAMILSVYDKRLDSFQSYYRSSLYIPAFLPNTTGAYVSSSRNYSSSCYVSKQMSYLTRTTLQLPDWLYQESYSTLSRRFNRPLRTAARQSDLSSAVEVADAEEAQVTDAEDINLSSSNVALYGSRTGDSSDINMKAVADELVNQTLLDNVELRNSADYLALWHPSLRSDSKGFYSLDFLVPNANTTWHLTGFAWTKDGKNVAFEHDFVAAKPIMVSLNAPQFVRGDDRAQIAISVMNNSDEVQSITIAAYVDADTLALGTIAKQTFSKTLQPGASEILNITLDATQAALQNAGVAYVAAKISNGTFSDGERVKVPVLPSQTQVINSTNFYLNPGDTDYSFDVPDAAGDNFTCSLTFTENPMWTIVEALPLLTAEDNILPTANRQAAAYFSAAVALGLMKQHPELELKFNAANLKKILLSTQQNLLDLQQPNGSWRWGRWCSFGELYTTELVLSLFAILKQSGYLPADNKLTAALNSAVAYCDGAVSETDMQYTIFRPIFSNVTQSLNGKKVSNATVQAILKKWKKFDVTYKAQAALALHNNGNENMAKTLISSLDEFGTQTASKGFEFKNVTTLYSYAWLLQTYASIVPNSSHVDGIRQYLIVRKQATDWGNYPTTSQIVSAMINSGTKWTDSAEGATVSVDGSPIDVQALGRMGTLTTELTGRHVSISTSGKTPAYGAIIAKYNAPMKDVEAYSDGEISINKTMYVQRDGKWQDVDSLRVGEKVKIVLTVKASRPFSNLIVSDDRAATFLPSMQTSRWVYGDGISAYRENRTSSTILYINSMPKGTYLLEYEMSVNNAGQFASGIATVTCTQAPELTAHSAGSMLSIY